MSASRVEREIEGRGTGEAAENQLAAIVRSNRESAVEGLVFRRSLDGIQVFYTAYGAGSVRCKAAGHDESALRIEPAEFECVVPSQQVSHGDTQTGRRGHRGRFGIGGLNGEAGCPWRHRAAGNAPVRIERQPCRQTAHGNLPGVRCDAAGGLKGGGRISDIDDAAWQSSRRNL